MTHHPHVHMIVPGGGISLDGTRWVSGRPGFLLPVRVLSRLFRRLFLAGLAATKGHVGRAPGGPLTARRCYSAGSVTRGFVLKLGRSSSARRCACADGKSTKRMISVPEIAHSYLPPYLPPRRQRHHQRGKVRPLRSSPPLGHRHLHAVGANADRRPRQPEPSLWWAPLVEGLTPSAAGPP
jgi:hypothetical protein